MSTFAGRAGKKSKSVSKCQNRENENFLIRSTELLEFFCYPTLDRWCGGVNTASELYWRKYEGAPGKCVFPVPAVVGVGVGAGLRVKGGAVGARP